METTLEAKDYSPERAERALVKALRGKRGQLTKADAVAASGLPTHLADDALERMLKRYRSRLAVTEDGQLLYSFDPDLRRRDEPTLGERLAAFGRLAARAGIWLFKALITVTLIAYVIVFVLVILAAMFGGGNRDSDRRRGRGFDLGWLWLLFWPDYGMGYRRYPHDAWGRPYGEPPRRRERSRGKKPILQAVYDFVFGPARPVHDPLEDEREILAWLRAHGGRITATDLVSLFGWSYRRAEEEVTRLMVDYDGTPEITEEGVLVYAFPDILKTARDEQLPATVRHAWERLETRPALTGNESGTDLLIGGFAIFNLIASLFAGDWLQRRYGIHSEALDFWLAAFPLTFFGIFLAIPTIRAFARTLGDRGRARRNALRQGIRAVLEAPDATLPDAPNRKELAAHLEGEPDFVADRVVWKFPRVLEEQTALARHMRALDTSRERKIGPVIFDSDEDPQPN